MTFKLSQRTYAALVAGAATVALTACTAASTDSAESAASTAASDGKLQVLTAFYPLQYLAEEIGGDLVEISSLTPPGAEPHDLELTPAKVQEIGSADAVIFLKGFQTAVDEAVVANPPAHLIDVTEAAQLAETPEATVLDAEASATTETHADHDHAEETEAEHDHADETASGETHDHDHDLAGDPHFWLDPTRMAQAATAIGQAFASADPTNADTYTSNATAVAEKLNALSTTLVDGTAQCEHTTFVTAHTAFGYLAARTGLTQVGIAGLDPEAAPSPARLKEISDLVKAQGLTTIFTETLIDPAVAEVLAQDLGITTAVLDPLESQSDSAKDYIDVMNDNITALRTALSCK